MAREIPGIKCPRCGGTVHVATADGTWERSILPLLSIHVFRCNGCRHRFRRFKTGLQAKRHHSPERMQSERTGPETKNGSFQDLIDQMKATEQELGQSKKDDRPKRKH